MHLPAWVAEATALPLTFAQVREDPRIDLEVCSILPDSATVVMIASGGDTAICLGRRNLARLILVDMNPAQLALTQCKWHLAQFHSRQESLEWLGHSPLPAMTRLARISETLQALSLPSTALGPLPLLAETGPDFAGRYEKVFAALREELGKEGEDLRKFLESERTIEQPHPTFRTAMEQAFNRVMSLENLQALFGREATQNPRQSFATHFLERTWLIASRSAPRTNPFLWQMLAGRFPTGGSWDWLNAADWHPPNVSTERINAKMGHALEGMAPESVDLVHLSNILDWLSPADAARDLASAYRVLRPNGRVLLRQLNSTLDIRALPSGFEWDAEHDREMEARDRSFFYPFIHLGRKT